MNSVLKPATLTLPPDHNYACNLVATTVSSTANGKHGMCLDDTSSTPSKRFQASKAIAPSVDGTGMDLENHSDEGFTLVEGKKCNSSSSSHLQQTSQRYKTIIHNRFDPLSSTIDNNDDVQPTPPKPQSVPPIFLHDSNNYQALISDLDKLLKNDYYTVNKGTGIKINVSTSDDYRALTAHFDSVNVQYHSFCPPDKKRLSVIMRNVPISLTDEEISTELKTKHFPVQKVSRLYNKNKYPMPLCAIELDDSDAGNEIFALEFLFHSKIQIELKRKAKTIPQCTRCQRFGHTKNYCRLEPRCVKCPGNHHFSECPKKKDDPVQCVNCNEAHTANYRGCSHYLKLKSRPNQNKNVRLSGPSNASNHDSFDATSINFPPLKTGANESVSRSQNSDLRSPHHSFASAVNGTTSKRPETNNVLGPSNEQSEKDPLRPVLTSLLSFIKPYIPQIKSFFSELVSSIFRNGF